MQEKIFAGAQQRTFGESPVCTCCNVVLGNGSKSVTIEGHELHDDCGERLPTVVSLKEKLKPVILALPSELLDGSSILQRLTTVYAVSGLRLALKKLCAHFADQTSKREDPVPVEKAERAIAAITAVVKESTIASTLTPVLALKA